MYVSLRLSDVGAGCRHILIVQPGNSCNWLNPQCLGKLLMSRYSVEVREVPTLSNLSVWLRTGRMVKKDEAGSAVDVWTLGYIGWRMCVSINEGRTKLKAPKTYVDRSHGEKDLVIGRRDGTTEVVSLCATAFRCWQRYRKRKPSKFRQSGLGVKLRF